MFESLNGNYKTVIESTTDEIDKIISCLEQYNKNITFVGDGAEEFESILLENFPNCKFSSNNKCSSVSIGIAAFKHYNNNLNFDDSLSPMYLKKSQAERQLEEGKLKWI